MKKLLIVALALPLAGCLTDSGALQSLQPVCEALGPPIHYNGKNKNSDWHAGPNLANRLDQQYEVGTNLPCPGY